LVAAGFGTALILWTEVTVTILAVIAGVFLLIEGVIEIIAAFQIKSASPPEVALPDTTGRAEAAG
jgi:uncharacterized membrane protein HdeD (DUF308 family)